jgi:hypothetical protein
MKQVNDFISPFVDRAIEMAKKDPTGVHENKDGQDFTHSLSMFTKDKKHIRDQLVSTLLAGRDTTACALSWLFYELAYHPDVYARLREEIVKTLGRHSTPTYEDLKGMKYLQWCLNESKLPSPPEACLCKLSAYILLFRSTYEPPWWTLLSLSEAAPTAKTYPRPSVRPSTLIPAAYWYRSRNLSGLLRDVHATT